MLDFLTLKPEAFGLDISDLSLKIIKLKKRGKFLGLASFSEAKIPLGIIESGEIKDEEKLVKVIKDNLNNVKGEKLKTNYIVASLPEEKAFLQIIQMPQMPEENLKKAVFFEAENYIPLPIDQVYIDFQTVWPVLNHLDHLDLLLAALPKNTVEPYVSVFKKAGLKPKVLEIESQAISRALIKKEVSPTPLLLIDMGETRTSFIIFAGYSLRFTTSIPVSSQGFTQAIAKTLKIPEKEAERLKIDYGLKIAELGTAKKREAKTSKESKEVFEALLPSLIDLIEQIKKHLDYYQTHSKHEHLEPDDKGVEKILLSGGGANLKGLADFLSLELKLPVELANPWANILPEPLREVPELSYERSLGYTTALGLALRGLMQK